MVRELVGQLQDEKLKHAEIFADLKQAQDEAHEAVAQKNLHLAEKLKLETVNQELISMKEQYHVTAKAHVDQITKIQSLTKNIEDLV